MSDIDKLKEELSNKIDKAVKKRCEHNNPSKDTLRLFREQEKIMQEQSEKIISLEVCMKQVVEELKEIKQSLKDFRKDIKDTYVSKTEFKLTISPMQKIVYGMVGTILTSVLLAIIYIVIK